MTSENIHQRIESFQKRFGEAHLYLAYHAAFPLSLTPDLMYRIWMNFQRDNKGNSLKNQNGFRLNIPWIAVSDLLLSDFCKEVAHELYEMDQEIRNELLKRMRADERFGRARIKQLSEFLLKYIEDQLNSHDPYIRNFANAQKWITMAYTEPGKIARDLAEALSSKVKENDKGGVIRVASLVETVAEPLIDAGLEYLQIYSNSMERYARDDIKGAKDQIKRLKAHSQFAGAELSFPEEVLRYEFPLENNKSVEDFISENIVEIRCFKENQVDCNGTGFFISESLIVTCYHCVSDENKDFYNKIQIRHQKFEKEAKIALYSKEYDYAVLYIAGTCPLLPFPLADKKDIETILSPNITKIYSYGFCEPFENKRNKKAIRAIYFAREYYNRDVFTFKVDEDTAIHKGQSGSPICVVVEGNPKPLLIGMLQEDVEEGKYNEDKTWKKMCVLPITEIIDKFNEINQKIKFLPIEQHSLIDQFMKRFLISSIQIDFNILNKEFGLNLEGLGFHDANNFARIYGGRLPTEEEWLIAIKYAGNKIRISDNTKEWLNPVRENKKILIMDTKYKCALEHRPDAVSPNYVFRIVKEIRED